MICEWNEGLWMMEDKDLNGLVDRSLSTFSLNPYLLGPLLWKF